MVLSFQTERVRDCSGILFWGTRKR